MTTPTLDQFLDEIARVLRGKDGQLLQQLLILEPPLPPLYAIIVTELRTFFPSTAQHALEEKCRNFLPEHEEGDEGISYTSFVWFLVKYFAFVRDVDVSRLVETHDMLKALLKLVHQLEHVIMQTYVLAVNAFSHSVRPLELSSYLQSSLYHVPLLAWPLD